MVVLQIMSDVVGFQRRDRFASTKMGQNRACKTKRIEGGDQQDIRAQAYFYTCISLFHDLLRRFVEERGVAESIRQE